MPGRGRIVERAFTPEESTTMLDALPVLGDKTFDVCLNEEAFWRNVPAAVWDYRLGGYRVLKKWLSYRERKVLGRNLQGEEVQQFVEIARRIAAVLMMAPLQTPRGDFARASWQACQRSRDFRRCSRSLDFRGCSDMGTVT